MEKEILNIVIPMAGRGSRFTEAGFFHPKPLIKIHGKPMIQVVIENLTPKIPHRFIFICQKQHIKDYQLDKKINSYVKNAHIIEIDEITKGQACSVLLAKDFINNSAPLLTANVDQFIDADINDFIGYARQKKL